MSLKNTAKVYVDFKTPLKTIFITYLAEETTMKTIMTSTGKLVPKLIHRGEGISKSEHQELVESFKVSSELWTWNGLHNLKRVVGNILFFTSGFRKAMAFLELLENCVDQRKMNEIGMSDAIFLKLCEERTRISDTLYLLRCFPDSQRADWHKNKSSIYKRLDDLAIAVANECVIEKYPDFVSKIKDNEARWASRRMPLEKLKRGRKKKYLSKKKGTDK